MDGIYTLCVCSAKAFFFLSELFGISLPEKAFSPLARGDAFVLSREGTVCTCGSFARREL